MTYEIPGTTHRHVDTNGVRLSVYEAKPSHDVPADRPVVVFSHGFPELAYTWRHQMRAVADAGFHVLAPDQRGYGGSDRPADVREFDIFHLTGDLVGLLDDVGAEKGVFVGHDWGGFVVWQMPLQHRDRVAGVVGLNTPFIARLPMRPTEVFRMVGGENHYILYFQEPGVADAALASNVDVLFDRMMRRGVDPEAMREAAGNASDFIEAVVEAPVMGDELLTETERQVFVEEFTRTGFTGGLNWYRNFDHNWEATPEQEGARLDDLPCLMITAEWDPVLVPALAQGMPDLVSDLEMHQIAKCGHWTQQEHPDETNRLLIDFLTRRFT